MPTYSNHLESLQDKGLYRSCRVLASDIEGLSWPVVQVQGAESSGITRSVVDFCSNNYLGFAQHPRLIAASVRAAQKEGVGARAARLVSGTLRGVQGLEQLVAEFKQTESALVMNSGYQANVSILQALLGRNDRVFMDRLNHASLVDGAVLSRAKLFRYRHSDMADLANALAKDAVRQIDDCKRWIVTDSVFSMDGDTIEPVFQELVALARQYDAYLLLDEAHATGLWGVKRSSGLFEHLLESSPQGVATWAREHVVLMGTFSKALGGFGAYVAGATTLIQMLVNHARGFIYSTALPPPVIAVASESISVLQEESGHQQALWDNVAYFLPKLNSLLAANQLPVSPSTTQIIPVILGERTMVVSQELLEKGFFIQGIRSPTVPLGEERLRISLSSSVSGSSGKSGML